MFKIIKILLIKDVPLNINNWQKVGLRYISDISVNDKILPIEYFKEKLVNNPALMFEFNAFKTAYKGFMDKIDKNFT